MRAEGLEPPRLSPLEPKSSASTSSATPAGPIALRASKRSAAIVKPQRYTHFRRRLQQKNDGSAKKGPPPLFSRRPTQASRQREAAGLCGSHDAPAARPPHPPSGEPPPDAGRAGRCRPAHSPIRRAAWPRPEPDATRSQHFVGRRAAEDAGRRPGQDPLAAGAGSRKRHLGLRRRDTGTGPANQAGRDAAFQAGEQDDGTSLTALAGLARRGVAGRGWRFQPTSDRAGRELRIPADAAGFGHDPLSPAGTGRLLRAGWQRPERAADRRRARAAGRRSRPADARHGLADRRRSGDPALRATWRERGGSRTAGELAHRQWQAAAAAGQAATGLARPAPARQWLQRADHAAALRRREGGRDRRRWAADGNLRTGSCAAALRSGDALRCRAGPAGRSRRLRQRHGADRPGVTAGSHRHRGRGEGAACGGACTQAQPCPARRRPDAGCAAAGHGDRRRRQADA